MNKTELINAISTKLGSTKVAASEALNAVTAVIGEALAEGQDVKTELGTFKIVSRAARTARNPRSGTPVQVPARKVVRFRTSSELKRIVK